MTGPWYQSHSAAFGRKLTFFFFLIVCTHIFHIIFHIVANPKVLPPGKLTLSMPLESQEKYTTPRMTFALNMHLVNEKENKSIQWLPMCNSFWGIKWSNKVLQEAYNPPTGEETQVNNWLEESTVYAIFMDRLLKNRIKQLNWTREEENCQERW